MRKDSYYSVAYWYQAEPHAPFPPLPLVQDRLPTLMFTGGPGNGPQPDVGPPPPVLPAMTHAPGTPYVDKSKSGTRTESEPSPQPSADKPPAVRQ